MKYQEVTKEKLKEEIRRAVKEVQFIKQGKLKSRPIEAVLRELDVINKNYMRLPINQFNRL